ncbi:MAG: DNA adenine methylase [Candidatus Gastranaerophilales bacterium]|nr:DNA adenine methylase [Candidatus Gastranaerophilales bacterium]
MRYIGNKTNLLKNIEIFIEEKIPKKDNMIFCDLFSGTASVARYFKQQYQIISNDVLYFSYVLQKSTIELNKKPHFDKLLHYLSLNSFTDLLIYLENSNLNELQNKYEINDDELFVYNNYTPSSDLCERMYFRPTTGKRIDIIRILLNKWKNMDLIDDDEFIYLLAILIETVTYYSNISGVYGAYLKKWDKRTNKKFYLRNLKITNNNKRNYSYNEDAHDLIRKIEGDILYLDPPYNNRQYPPNYHVLETISKYDYPEIKGISGMRDYSNQISRFCRKKEVKQALEDIVSNAKFKYIFLSYNTEGLLSISEIEEVFKKYGKEDTYCMAKPIVYRKYKSKQKQSKKELYELLFFVEKDIKWRNIK